MRSLTTTLLRGALAVSADLRSTLFGLGGSLRLTAPALVLNVGVSVVVLSLALAGGDTGVLLDLLALVGLLLVIIVGGGSDGALTGGRLGGNIASLLILVLICLVGTALEDVVPVEVFEAVLIVVLVILVVMEPTSLPSLPLLCSLEFDTSKRASMLTIAFINL